MKFIRKGGVMVTEKSLRFETLWLHKENGSQSFNVSLG